MLLLFFESLIQFKRPVTLKRRQSTAATILQNDVNETWTKTKKSLKRLASNKIFTLNLFSSCVSVFIFSGFATFMPKFYQIWFRFRASTSGLGQIGAFTGQISGLVTGGIIIYKFQPRATYLCIWTVLGSLIMILGLIGVSYTSCQRAPWIYPGGKTFTLHPTLV